MNVLPTAIVQLVEVPDASDGRMFVVTQSVMLTEPAAGGVAVDASRAIDLLPWKWGAQVGSAAWLASSLSVAINGGGPAFVGLTAGVAEATTGVTLQWVAHPGVGTDDTLTDSIRASIEAKVVDMTGALVSVAFVVGSLQAGDEIVPLPGAPSVTLWQQLHGLGNLPGPTCWLLGIAACFRLTGPGLASYKVVAAPAFPFDNVTIKPDTVTTIVAPTRQQLAFRWRFQTVAGTAFASAAGEALVFAAPATAARIMPALIQNMWVLDATSRNDDWQAKLPARFAATLDLARLLLDTAQPPDQPNLGMTATKLKQLVLRALRLSAGTGIIAGIDKLPAARGWVRAGGYGSETALATLAAYGLKTEVDDLGLSDPSHSTDPSGLNLADHNWLTLLTGIAKIGADPKPGTDDFQAMLAWLRAIYAALANSTVFSSLVLARWQAASVTLFDGSVTPVPIWMSLRQTVDAPPGGVIARGLVDVTQLEGVLDLDVALRPAGVLRIAVCDGETPVSNPAGTVSAAEMITATLTMNAAGTQWQAATTGDWTIDGPATFPATNTSGQTARYALSLTLTAGMLVLNAKSTTHAATSLKSSLSPPRNIGSTNVGVLIAGSKCIRVVSASVASVSGAVLPVAPPAPVASFRPRDKLIEAAVAPVWPMLTDPAQALPPDKVAAQVTDKAGKAVASLIALRFGSALPTGLADAIQGLVVCRAAGFLVPPHASIVLPVHTALPIVLPFDTFADRTSDDDYWSSYCGIGAIMQRQSRGGVPTGWYSLNAASAVVTSTTVETVLDPVPFVVGTSNGVQTSELVFDNRPIIAPVSQTTPPPISPNSPIYRFQHAGETKPIPSLIFGCDHQFALYTIGPGGVLPLELRGDIHPAVMRPGPISGLTLPAGVTRTVTYRRRVPLGPPVIDGRVGAPVFPTPSVDVQPLASELPSPPDAFLIGPTTARVMYLGAQGGGIDLGSGSTLRIDLLEIDFNAGSVPATTLTMALQAPAGAGPETWTFTFKPGNPGDTLTVVPAGSATDAEIRIAITLPPPDGPYDVRLLIDGKTLTVSTLPGLHARTETMPLPWETEGTPQSKQSALPAAPAFPAWLEFSAPGVNANSAVSIVVPDILLGGQSVTDPDRGASGRQIALIPATGTTRFRVRPPAVEFQTWLRWIRQTPSTTLNDRIAAAVDAGAMAGVASRASRGQEAARLDDPAAIGIVIGWRDVFPARGAPNIVTRVVRFKSNPESFKPGLDQRLGIDIYIAATDADKPTIVPGDADVTVNLPVGAIIDLDIHAVAVAADFASCFDTGMDAGLWRGTVTYAGAVNQPDIVVSAILGLPLRLRVEVAADHKVSAFDVGSWLAITNPASGTGWPGSAIALSDTTANIALTQPGFAEYQVLRRAASVRVMSRTWAWNGRPLPSSHITTQLFADYSDVNINPLDIAFLGVAQVIGGSTPRLLKKDLNWRSGVPVWQFSGQLINRYQSMLPPDAPAPADPTWRHQTLMYVVDRAGPPLPPPRVALVLPLTQALDADAPDRPLPPVMVLIEEAWHTNGDFTERLHCVIETVRLPLGAGDLGKTQRLYQQAGPDPTLTGYGSAESVTNALAARAVAVPLIIHGAAGLATEPTVLFPDFTATSFLVEMQPPGSPAEVTNWLRSPFLRLRFRRIREPGYLNAPIDDNPLHVQAVCHDMTLPAGWSGIISVVTGSQQLDIAVTRGTRTKLTTKLSTPATPDTVDWGPDWHVDEKFPDPFGDPITLRVLISPQGPRGGGWGVALAVSADNLAPTAEPWVFGPVVTIRGAQSPTISSAPAVAALSTNAVRASDWTSPLWCQFSPDSSRFSVTWAGDTTELVSVRQLRILSNTDPMTIQAKHRTMGWLPVTNLVPMGGPNVSTKSKAEVLLAAVITQMSVDIFGATVEDVCRSTDGPLHLVSASGTIPAPPGKLTRPGRLRLLSLVRYVNSDKTKPLLQQLFPLDADAMNDAGTRIVGISEPIDFES